MQSIAYRLSKAAYQSRIIAQAASHWQPEKSRVIGAAVGVLHFTWFTGTFPAEFCGALHAFGKQSQGVCDKVYKMFVLLSLRH